VIGNDALIWINELNWFLHRHQAVSLTRAAAKLGLQHAGGIGPILSSTIEQFDPSQVGELLAELRAVTGVDAARLARDHRLYLDWDQIREMSQEGVAFGNHTVTHPVLDRLPPEACQTEIRAAAQVLRQLPGATETLAYPFGGHDETTRQIALELGCRSILDVEGVNRDLDPTRIGRIKVGSHSAAVLFARMEIVEPFKATIKRLLRLLRAA
jgi:hypothetical protein